MKKVRNILLDLTCNHKLFVASVNRQKINFTRTQMMKIFDPCYYAFNTKLFMILHFPFKQQKLNKTLLLFCFSQNIIRKNKNHRLVSKLARFNQHINLFDTKRISNSSLPYTIKPYSTPSRQNRLIQKFQERTEQNQHRLQNLTNQKTLKSPSPNPSSFIEYCY
jgi:hypothetical protein